jgi:hypothetical protein
MTLPVMTTEPRRLGVFAYIFGALSFIPLLGVPFGFVAILWGLLTRKAGRWALVAMGTAGTLVTVAAYGSLFYFGFVQRGGLFDDLRTKLAQTAATNLVQAIEFYKVQNGRYPESLDVLTRSQPKESTAAMLDARQFHYEVVGKDHYRLVGLGADGVPFTGDDVHPAVTPTPGSKLGLLRDR